MSRRPLIWCFALLVCGPGLHASTLYNWESIGPETTYTQAINNAGIVAGFVGPRPSFGISGNAYVYSGGVQTIIGRPDGSAAAYATGINDAGTVVGYGLSGGFGITTGFTFSNGVMASIGLPGASQSAAMDINTSGQIVGWSNVGGQEEAFLVSGGVTTVIDGLIRALQINDSGQILGITHDINGIWDLALITDGQIQQLGLNNTNNIVLALHYALNNLGQVVGQGQQNGGSFLYSDGTIQSFPTGPNGEGFQALDINDLGQVVGSIGSSATAHAAIYQGGQVQDLNDLMAPGATSEVLVGATRINNAGQIAGQYYSPSVPYQVGFLITPVPEPGTVTLLLSGALIPFLVRLRRLHRGRLG